MTSVVIILLLGICVSINYYYYIIAFIIEHTKQDL